MDIDNNLEYESNKHYLNDQHRESLLDNKNKTFKKIIVINCSSEEDRIITGKLIHEQLKGNKDYIDSNILLDIHSEPNYIIKLYIFEECKEIPKILI